MFAGTIVEIDGKESLWVVVKGDYSREDAGSCCYDRDYYVIPYTPELDELEIDLSKTTKIEVKFVTTDLLKERTDKMPYTKCGVSNIKGVEKIYLERIWPTAPAR